MSLAILMRQMYVDHNVNVAGSGGKVDNLSVKMRKGLIHPHDIDEMEGVFTEQATSLDNCSRDPRQPTYVLSTK